MTASGAGSGSTAQLAGVVTSKPNDITGLAFNLDVAIEAVAGSTEGSNRSASMEMKTLKNISANETPSYAIRFGYYANGTVHYSETQFNNETTKADYWRTYKITVSVPSGTQTPYGQSETFTQAEIKEILKNVQLDVTISADAVVAEKANPTSDETAAYNAKYGTNLAANETLPGVAASKARFYTGASSSNKVAPTGETGINNGNTLSSITIADQTLGDNGTFDVYVGMYVEGEGVDYDSTGADIAPNGNFTVNVAV